MMRKMHYNEGLNIKLARQLIASELEEDAIADEEMGEDTEEAKEDTGETEEISVDPPQEGRGTGDSMTVRINLLDSFQSPRCFSILWLS